MQITGRYTAILLESSCFHKNVTTYILKIYVGKAVSPELSSLQKRRFSHADCCIEFVANRCQIQFGQFSPSCDFGNGQELFQQGPAHELSPASALKLVKEMHHRRPFMMLMMTLQQSVSCDPLHEKRAENRDNCNMKDAIAQPASLRRSKGVRQMHGPDQTRCCKRLLTHVILIGVTFHSYMALGGSNT